MALFIVCKEEFNLEMNKTEQYSTVYLVNDCHGILWYRGGPVHPVIFLILIVQEGDHIC